VTFRRIGLAIALGTLVVSGYYVLAYLYWWEWNRALVAGVFFLAIEAAIGVLVVLGRIDRLERRLESEGRLASHRRTVDVLHSNAPPQADRFAWLDPKRSPNQLNVFVPILLGAGVLLSGAAWLIERAARMFATPTLERGLATQLDRLSVPPGGFLRPADDAFLREPTRR
jgi:hypothetical protein